MKVSVPGGLNCIRKLPVFAMKYAGKENHQDAKSARKKYGVPGVVAVVLFFDAVGDDENDVALGCEMEFFAGDLFNGNGIVAERLDFIRDLSILEG